MTIPSYPLVPDVLDDEEKHRMILAQAINAVMDGMLNCVVDMTLAHDATETLLKDNRIHPFCFIAFEPSTAHAAAIVSSVWTSEKKSGQVKVHHSSTANTDQTFKVIILG